VLRHPPAHCSWAAGKAILHYFVPSMLILANQLQVQEQPAVCLSTSQRIPAGPQVMLWWL
jgi:hypothetical protein